MKTTRNRRIIINLTPHLLGSALATWLERRAGAEVVVDPSGSTAARATSRDVVVSSTPLASDAAVVVVAGDGTYVLLHRNGSFERHRYSGLERLASLIEEQRAPPIAGASIGNGGCG